MGISKEIGEGRVVMRTDLQLGWVHGCAERCRQERMSIKMPSKAQLWGAFSTAYSRILYSDSVNLQTSTLSVFSCVWILCASCACESVWVIGVCVCACVHGGMCVSISTHVYYWATAFLWRSEDNIYEAVLPFHCDIWKSNSGPQAYWTSAFTNRTKQ